MGIKDKKHFGAKRVISILLAVLIIFSVLFPEGGIKILAMPGITVGVSATDAYLTAKTERYTQLRALAEELSGNITALLGVAEGSASWSPQYTQNLNGYKARMDALATEAEQTAKNVADYYTGASDSLTFSFTSDQVISAICSLSDDLGDPSGCRRDYQIIAVQLGAALSDADSAVNGNDILLAGRALFEYADSVENIGKTLEASGLYPAAEELKQYKERWNDPSDYDSFNEVQVVDAYLCFGKVFRYYEWLLGYFKVLDYRDYLSDHMTALTTEEEEALAKIDEYTFREIPKMEKTIKEELFPLLSMVPEKYDPVSAASGGAINVKLNKYADLETEISAFLINAGALKAAEESKQSPDPSIVGVLEQTIAGLNSLSGELGDTVRGFTDYYSGTTTDLGFSVGDIESRTVSYKAPEPGFSSPASSLYTEASDYANNAISKGMDALMSDNHRSMMEALFNYADFLERIHACTASVMKNFREKINKYETDYSDPSEYLSYSDEQAESAAATFSTIGRYYRWMFDRYVLFDYRDYLSDPGVTVSGKENVIERIDYYTFAYQDRIGAIVEALIPYGYLLSDTYRYCGRASAGFATLETTLAYNGNDQTLLSSAAAAEGGTPVYALSESSNAAPAESAFSSDIPKGKDTGKYYVWYKAKGDRYHSDSIPQCIEVVIAAPEPETVQVPDPDPAPAPAPVYRQNIYPDEPKPVEKKVDGLTTTEEVKNPDGTVSEISVTKLEEGSITRETVRDGDGRFVEYRYEYTRTRKNGTTFVQTFTEKADGSKKETSVTTTKSGTVTTKVKEQTADGAVILREEKKRADGSVSVIYDAAEIEKNFLKNDKTITKLTIGENVTVIGESAFKNMTGLKSITINAANLRSIGKNAFKGVGTKKRVTINIKAETDEEFDEICNMIMAAGAGKKVRFVKI